MAKFEIVCNKEDAQEMVRILSEHGETGDGIIYVSEVQQIPPWPNFEMTEIAEGETVKLNTTEIW